MTRLLTSFVVGLALSGGAWSAAAVAYPTRPVTLVLGFAPGGPSDVMARIFASKLEQALGQPVVIENRSGAGGNVAGETVARAAPDGYTLLLANCGILAANASLYKRTGFDPERDFTPITLVGAQANVLVIHPAVPAKSLAELIAHAKANPGKLSYASGGHGSSPHLAGELLKTEAKINIVHVPYKGTGLAMQDLVAGHVQMMFPRCRRRSRRSRAARCGRSRSPRSSVPRCCPICPRWRSSPSRTSRRPPGTRWSACQDCPRT